nr:MAG TPA: hypothetical protein [Caudoviricetes sp.]
MGYSCSCSACSAASLSAWMPASTAASNASLSG